MHGERRGRGCCGTSSWRSCGRRTWTSRRRARERRREAKREGAPADGSRRPDVKCTASVARPRGPRRGGVRDVDGEGAAVGAQSSTREEIPVLAAARRYLGRGLAVIPVPAGTKAPVL